MTDHKHSTRVHDLHLDDGTRAGR